MRGQTELTPVIAPVGQTAQAHSLCLERVRNYNYLNTRIHTAFLPCPRISFPQQRKKYHPGQWKTA